MIKKLISLILSVLIALCAVTAGSFSAYATEVSKDCKKILIIGNSYTYFNALDQTLSCICNAAGEDALVVSAVKSGHNIDELTKEKISYYAWYNGSRLIKGKNYLNGIIETDFASLNRKGTWDYIIFNYNSPEEVVIRDDIRILALVTDNIESNKKLIINSGYWIDDVEKNRLSEHLTVCKVTGCSLVDTRGIFTQYSRLYPERLWFKDFTLRDDRNHPGVWGTYVTALTFYAKIFGVSKLAESPESEEPLALYNSDDGDISEFINVELFKNSYEEYPSITKSTAARLQYLVRSNAESYIGDLNKSLVPPSDKFEGIVYYDESGEAITGWSVLSGYEYYLKNGEVLRDGIYKIDNEKFYFDFYGERHSGRYIIDGKNYYLFSDGSVATGWVTIPDNKGVFKTFRFSDKGVLYTGKKTIDGKTYLFSKGRDGKELGEMYCNEWRTYTTSSGKTRTQYFNSNGVMLTGLKKIGEKTYYFNKDGLLQKSAFIKVKKKTYFVNKNGVIQKNRIVKYNGSRYYLNKEGALVKNRKVKVKGKKYRADSTGRLTKIKKKTNKKI